MNNIILATVSPYRKETFKVLGLSFDSEESGVDESQIARSNPEELVRELSRLKAEKVAENHSKAVIIGFDSVGYFNGQILEKPKLREESFQRLKDLSGGNHKFYTGIHMINITTGQTLAKVVETEVFLRELSEQEINRYLDEDPDFNTYALGYDPYKHYSSTFIKSIKGSYYNLLQGLPLETIVEMLAEIGYESNDSKRMKITIIGSVKFRKQMVDFRNKLNQMGHEGIIHPIMEDLALGRRPELMEQVKKDHSQVKRDGGFIKWYHDAIKDSDAVLVLNFGKNGIKNYIGGNTLMEIAFAHVNNKRVFLLNSIPEDVSYSDEIEAMTDIVLNGDLTKIKRIKDYLKNS